MLRLASLDNFKTLVYLDPESNRFQLSEKSKEDLAGGFVSAGLFSLVNGEGLCFFRYEGALWLLYKGERLSVDDACTAEFSREGFLSHLKLRRGGTVIFDLGYTVKERLGSDDAILSPMAEDEDFDIGLFIFNLLNDPERRVHIWTGLIT